ncbi:MAG: acetate--CoA ligase family protein, partial [Candidatus Omnitrophica bacterium]|nr:acetate--CoA ligase family protein [Candidatus Omnitrophota bacterium]
MMSQLDSIFSPKSIAVIGASRREEAVGHAVFKNLLMGEYQGVLYPINPKADSILGVKSYPSMLEVPNSVDLAILIVPAEASVSTFQQCVQKGIKGAIVISAGFKEVGKDGAAREKELADLARKHQIPLLGPNCLGVINTDSAVSMNASFARSMPKQGNISFISQSGALCTAVLDYAKGVNIGFSKFISMGNKAAVTELELLEYLSHDEKTDVILMYLEDISYPRELIDLCRRITGEVCLETPALRCKPILAIKSGRTLQGAKAASSHTGSLAGSDEVYTAIFAQGGIFRVDSVDELFDYAKAFSANKRPKGNRVAIVTNAGGPGIMATDASVRYGLEMAVVSEKTEEELKKVLPSTANIHNPIDVIGDAQHGRYETALKIALKDSHLDGVIVILTPQAMTDIEAIAEVIGKIASKHHKPVLACFMGIVDVSAGVKVLERWGVPHYRFPESAAKALAGMARYTAWVARPRTEYKEFKIEAGAARAILQKAVGQKRRNLTDLETMELLKIYGFPTLPMELCATPKAAVEAAERMGYPVVLKINSPDILHKIDVGGVRLNLCSRDQVERQAADLLESVGRKLPKAKILGVTVQKMAKKGREVILGLKRDERFGPILMFGLGGTYVEIFKDVTFRIAPIRELGAYNMIHSIKSYPILEGVRGEKPADIPKIEECLQRLSQLAMQCPEIAELDINPL